jgi:hypothetical protein
MRLGAFGKGAELAAPPEVEQPNDQDPPAANPDEPDVF